MIIGAIKVKDGLFIGDEFASKDLEFVVSNKVTHIVNCAGRQLTNVFESFGVKYLKFNWLENDQQVLFDQNTANDIFQFIEEAHQNGESCLVHSARGQSRSCCALAVYFMRKYKWKLYKALEFLNSRRPDLEVRASFYHQLTQMEGRLNKRGEGAISCSWDPQSELDMNLEQDEQLLRNTYMNSKSSPPADCWLDRRLFLQYLHDKRIKAIQWADESKDQPRKSHKRSKSGHVRSILKEMKQVVDKMNNINGNVFHVTVNNYLTPQEQVQPKVNNYFEYQKKDDLKKPDAMPSMIKNTNNSLVKRQHNDSLKKHQDQKALNNKLKPTKIPKPDERPRSAYVNPQQELIIPKPQVGNPSMNFRQFSPMVKGSSIPKATQLIPTSKHKGWRYPSPGQIQKTDDFVNSFINKPVWK